MSCAGCRNWCRGEQVGLTKEFAHGIKSTAVLCCAVAGGGQKPPLQGLVFPDHKNAQAF